MSGMAKLLYPHSEATKDELAELLEMALEGRRRVKRATEETGLLRILSDVVFVRR